MKASVRKIQTKTNWRCEKITKPQKQQQIRLREKPKKYLRKQIIKHVKKQQNQINRRKGCLVYSDYKN